MPRRAFDRDHRSSWISKVIFGERRHQGKCIRKSGTEELDYLGRCCQRVEAIGTLKGQKQDAGKRAVDVGQRDQHVMAPRPDVKSVLVEKMFATWARWNRQLFVTIVERLLRKVEPVQLEHFGANSRSRSVAADYNLGLGGCFFCRLFMA